MRLLIEAVRVIDSRQNIDKNPKVRSLVELCFLSSVILIENLSDELEDLRHEFVLVEVEFA